MVLTGHVRHAHGRPTLLQMVAPEYLLRSGSYHYKVAMDISDQVELSNILMWVLNSKDERSNS